MCNCSICKRKNAIMAKIKLEDLKVMEYELCEYLGFNKPTEKTYEQWQQHYGGLSWGKADELTAEHETKMFEEFGAHSTYGL